MHDLAPNFHCYYFYLRLLTTEAAECYNLQIVRFVVRVLEVVVAGAVVMVGSFTFVLKRLVAMYF